MTNNDRKNWYVLAGIILVLGGSCAAWLASVGCSDEHVLLPVRLTARAAFMLYLVVLVARPLQQLLRMDWTASLLRNRRLVGVAFAAVMTVHLALLAYRFGSQPHLEYPLFNLVFGGSAFGLFYLMLITSFDRPKRAMGPRAWKTLHRAGLILAGAIFGLPRSLESLTDPDYLKFGIPFAIALIIRITAWQLSRRPGE
jgi:DMSO/TMAO reductase YedYZ heme-binding membrane subunit